MREEIDPDRAELERDGVPGGEPAPGHGVHRRRRWPRRLAVALVLLLVGALALGPTLAAGWLRGEIERRGTQAIDGTVALEDLTLALNGKAVLQGLTITGASGELVAHVPIARIDVGLRSLLGGRKDVALLVEGADVELVRGEDGRWNIERLLETVTRDGEDVPSTEEGSDEPPPQQPPDVHGRLEITNSTITVRSPESVLQLRDVHFTVGLDGPDQDTALRFDATLFGGDGSAGVVHADISVWPDAGPGARIDDVSARGVALGAVAEALKIVGAPLEEGSVLEGEADLVVRGSLADLRPDAAFTLEVDGAAAGLVVDMRKDGVQAFAFAEDSATVQLRASGAGDGAEPRATAALRAREGRLAADVAWDGAAKQGLTFEVDVDGLEASAGLEPFLARVHPVFATAAAFEGANLGGLVTSRLSFQYDAPLPVSSFTGDGLAALKTEPLQGTGSLTVDKGLVETSPFFKQLLDALGQPSNPTFDLKPLGFAVESGRIAYTQPWTWTIQGAETRFVGSVGIDRSLDLSWVVPVSGALARQNRVFEALAGETFEVALGGTLTSPSFDLAGALSSLATKVGEQKLQDELARQAEKLQEKLKKELAEEGGGGAGAEAIGGVLSGGDPVKAAEEAARGILGGDADAGTLLKEADRLWDAGKKAEAATVYQRIRKDFPLSPTYLLNKSRIKGRRNG